MIRRESIDNRDMIVAFLEKHGSPICRCMHPQKEHNGPGMCLHGWGNPYEGGEKRCECEEMTTATKNDSWLGLDASP